jgi:hypothetical protein
MSQEFDDRWIAARLGQHHLAEAAGTRGALRRKKGSIDMLRKMHAQAWPVKRPRVTATTGSTPCPFGKPAQGASFNPI